VNRFHFKENAVIKGFATQEGTSSYAEQNRLLTYGEVAGTGLLASQAGFGCYRVDQSHPEHEKSLRKALLSGINLIDTSSNYGDGGAERLVGEVLQGLASSGEVGRESVIVVSKVGYLQGQNYQLSQERKQQGRSFKDLILYADGLEHCIHPAFLNDQLTRSLERLKLGTLDFYLLHNPEYYLSWASKTGVSLDEARQDYYRRIKLAFKHLEIEVEKGRIRFYGISSNTFPSAVTEPEFTSLERVWEIAASISSENHFRLMQLPMNLLETGAATEKNQSNSKSVIQFARDQQIGVLINRPLNAIKDNKLTRLADFGMQESVSEKEVRQAIEELIESEKVLSRSIISSLRLQPQIESQITEQAAVGQILQQHWLNFGSYERWSELRDYYFLPRVRGVMEFLTSQTELPENVSGWMASHQDKIATTFAGITSRYVGEAAKKSERIKRLVSSVDKDWSQAPTLSQVAVRALRSTSGITTVLVGMRRESYVEDVLEELARPVNINERIESWHQLRDKDF
jgi:hypothetical protein